MPHAPDRFAFGDFLLERSQQTLRHRDGHLIELAPRLFSALLLFVDRAGELLDKDELFAALWPGLVVEENNLSQIVHGLRLALGDDQRPSRYLQTVPRRGFRFIEAVTVLTVEPAPGNLRLLTASLYGRAADLLALQDMLSAHSVVSIVGTGGIGKTRLAFEAADAARAQFKDGVWWFDLSAVNKAALLPSAISSALGLSLPAGKPPLEALANALSDQQALLLLDNCEQVAGGVAQLIDTLRAAAGGLHFLLTSQQPVQATAEHVYRIGSLALPAEATVEAASQSSAVELFVDRASSQESHFHLAADNVEAVVDICRLLDGIPLALELAAVRVPLLGVQGLRDKLGQRFKLLTSGPGTRPARQQTLRAALEWSCALLSEAEATVLRRLGVFAGGFSLALAQHVASDEGIDEWKVLDLLGQLVDKSLLVVEAGVEPRYRLLETARSYALELLEAAGESEAWRRRHAEAMLAALELACLARWKARPTEDITIFRDLDNARAALDWSDSDPSLCIELHAASMQLWISAGLKAEGAERCAALAPTMDDRVPVKVAANFWLTVAMMGLFSAHQHCLEAAERAAALFRRLGDARGTYEALIVQTGVAARRSEHALAVAALAEAQTLMQPDWPARRRSALSFAAWVSALNARREAEAVQHGWQEVALSREAGSAFDEAIALGHVGIAEIYVSGQEAAGEARLREAQARLAAAGRPEAAGHISYSLCLALLRRGALNDAAEQARRAYRLLRRNGEQALMFGLLTLLNTRLERFDDAAQVMGYVDATYRRTGLQPRGLYAEAIALLQAALPAERCAALMAKGAALREEAFFALALGGGATAN